MAKPRLAKERTDLPVPQRHVSISNDLARSAQGLTLAAKRLVCICLAKTDTRSARDYTSAITNNGWVVRVSAAELADSAKIKITDSYAQLKDACDHLMRSRWQTFQDSKRGTKTTFYQWVTRATYNQGEGWCEVEFTHYTAPHLLMLKGKFTTYRLEQASALLSIFSWRLFECLQSWQGTGKWSPSIEEFTHAMDAKSYSSDFCDLRRRVIEPAVKELREKDGFLLEWETKKAGRKVTGLAFTFSKDPQGRLAL